MKKAMLLVLALAATAHAQLYLVPDNRVSVHTNGMVYLTNTVLQQDLSIIDTNLAQLHGSASSLSNGLLNVSNMVVGASNRADAAYDLALSATNVTPLHMAYVYTVSNTITLVSGTAGNAFFTTTTQDLAAVQIGHVFTTNLGLFATGSVVTAVDRTSGSNRVTFSGGGLLKNTNNVSITLTSAGSFTHTVPAGFSRCKVTVTGSGATGGSDAHDFNIDTGSGGGAGGTAICFLKLEAGSSVAITVGRRAAKGAAGQDGNDGNASSFGSYCTAYGGSKGLEADYSNGGYGGSAYGGSINIVGGQGDPWGWWSSAIAHGGSSFFGGGVASGRDVAPYGAGGSGWMLRDGHADNYGCAGDGIVIIEYY
jgi:hypothetical protein